MKTISGNNEVQNHSEQLNFILGIFLIVVAFLLMYSSDNLAYHRGKDVDILFLLISGFLSFAVSFTRKSEILFRVNVLLGMVSFLLAVLSMVVQVLNYTAWWEPFIHFDAGDVFFHALVAIAFFFIAGRMRQGRRGHVQ